MSHKYYVLTCFVNNYILMCLYRFIKFIHLIKLTQLDHDREYTSQNHRI